MKCGGKSKKDLFATGTVHTKDITSLSENKLLIKDIGLHV